MFHKFVKIASHNFTFFSVQLSKKKSFLGLVIRMFNIVDSVAVNFRWLNVNIIAVYVAKLLARLVHIF